MLRKTLRKTVAVTALAGLLTVGAAATASATPAAPAEPPPAAAPAGWVPIFYFGTQTYCTQAGMAGQQMGVLAAGRWMCDSGWLMVKTPNTP